MLCVTAYGAEDWRFRVEAASASGRESVFFKRGGLVDEGEIRVFLTASQMAELREALPGPEES
jgi:hypothetical protein